MNKKYLLLFVCGLLLSFTNAMAAVGNGVIKLKTNASKGQKIKMEMFIFGGWDEDGDALDNSPVYGDNFSVDGASNVTAAGNKVVMTADGPEITIHGDVDYLSIVGQGVTYIDVSKATELYELRVNENPITSIDLSNAPRLKVFWASNCKELATVSLENTPKLTGISLQGTQITALDLSNNPNLTSLNVGENQNLSSIDVTNGKARCFEEYQAGTLGMQQEQPCRSGRCQQRKNRVSFLLGQQDKWQFDGQADSFACERDRRNRARVLRLQQALRQGEERPDRSTSQGGERTRLDTQAGNRHHGLLYVASV